MVGLTGRADKYRLFLAEADDDAEDNLLHRTVQVIPSGKVRTEQSALSDPLSLPRWRVSYAMAKRPIVVLLAKS